MTNNNIAPPKKRRISQPKTTAADVADLVEYLVNEASDGRRIKTSRGPGSDFVLSLGRAKWLVKISKPARKSSKV